MATTTRKASTTTSTDVATTTPDDVATATVIWDEQVAERFEELTHLSRNADEDTLCTAVKAIKPRMDNLMHERAALLAVLIAKGVTFADAAKRTDLSASTIKAEAPAGAMVLLSPAHDARRVYDLAKKVDTDRLTNKINAERGVMLPAELIAWVEAEAAPTVIAKMFDRTAVAAAQRADVAAKVCAELAPGATIREIEAKVSKFAEAQSLPMTKVRESKSDEKKSETAPTLAAVSAALDAFIQDRRKGSDEAHPFGVSAAERVVIDGLIATLDGLPVLLEMDEGDEPIDA